MCFFCPLTLGSLLFCSLFPSPSLSLFPLVPFIHSTNIYYCASRAGPWASSTEQLFSCSCGMNSLDGKTNINQCNTAAVVNEHRECTQQRGPTPAHLPLPGVLPTGGHVIGSCLHFIQISAQMSPLLRDTFQANVSGIALPPSYCTWVFS